jgi:hypothetical protein
LVPNGYRTLHSVGFEAPEEAVLEQDAKGKGEEQYWLSSDATVVGRTPKSHCGQKQKDKNDKKSSKTRPTGRSEAFNGRFVAKNDKQRQKLSCRSQGKANEIAGANQELSFLFNINEKYIFSSLKSCCFIWVAAHGELSDLVFRS